MYTSAPFGNEENDETTFNVVVKFGKEEDNWLSVYLHPLNRRVTVHQYTFTILDVHLHEVNSQSITGQTIEEGAGKGWTKCFQFEDMSDDTHFLRCEILFEGDPSSAAKRQLKLSDRDPSFDDDLRKLCSDDANGDVTIIVGDRKFKAWKFLLMARSTYFKLLFESGMEESRSSKVNHDLLLARSGVKKHKSTVEPRHQRNSV